MPRRLILKPEEIFNSIGHLPFWDDNGNLKKKTQSIWTEARQTLGNKKSIDYVYLYISQNRHNIVNHIVERHGVNVREESKNNSNDSMSPNTSNWSTHDTCVPLPFKPLRTTLQISAANWKTIEPVLVDYEGESKYKLQQGWADVLYKEIWEQLKLPCAFAFQSEHVSMSGGTFLTLHGYCNECGNVLNAYAVQPPVDALTLYLSTYDSRRIIHHKKRQLKGSERQKVGQQLAAGTSTYELRRKVARRTMDFGDHEPANLHSEAVYRKAKQQFIDDELGVKGFVDPILSIQKLKYDPEYADFIRQVGLDKFYTMYWSEEQTFLYKCWTKDPNKVGHLAVDSTGKMWAPVKKSDGGSQQIQLYQLVVRFCDKILPVCQLITEKHDAAFISYWLLEWLRSGIPVPKSVVCDFSHALLNAISIAFTERRLGKYVDHCIKFLIQEEDSNVFEPPECVILVDIAHLIHLVSNWPCLAENTPLKNFCLRALALVTKATTLKAFLDTVRDILLVAMSKDGSLDTDHACAAATRRILEAIATNAFPYELDETSNEVHIEEGVSYESDTYEFATRFVQNLIDETQEKISAGPIGNPYYSPEFLKAFKPLLKYFPIWTPVMPDNCILVSSSAHNEQYFRELKRLCLKDSKKRADKALVKHIQNIQGVTKLLCAAYEKKNSQQRRTASKHSYQLSGRKDDDFQAEKNDFVDFDLERDENPENGRITTGKEQLTKLSHRKPAKACVRSFRRVNIQDGSDSSDSEDDKENESASVFPASPTMNDISPFANSYTPLKLLNPTSPRNLLISIAEGSQENPSFASPALSSTLFIGSDEDNAFHLQRNLAKRKLDKIFDPTDERDAHEYTSYYDPNHLNQEQLIHTSAPLPLKSDITLARTEDQKREQDVNEVDDWMSLLSQDARRQGHYVKPCPDILNRCKQLKMSKNKKRMPFLKNGLIGRIIQLGDQHISIRNTCAFDSVTQALLGAYHRSAEYAHYINDADNEFLKFIVSVDSANNVGQRSYKERAIILRRFHPVVGGKMDCAINISALIQKLLSTEPSCAVQSTCENCAKLMDDKQITIEIPFGPLHKDGMSALPEIVATAIRKRFDGKKGLRCPRCESERLRVVKIPGKHLIIDLEICLSIKLAISCGYQEWAGTFTIGQIPQAMEIWGQMYRLVAVIEFQGEIDLPAGSKSTGHYIAHVQSMNEKWKTFDDLSRATNGVSMSCRKILVKRKIPVLFYIAV